MNNALKGALLSGIIFPGAGQVALKHRTRGAVIILTVLASLVVFVAKATQRALVILEQIEMESGLIRESDISSAVSQVSAGSGEGGLNMLLLLMVGCWLASIVDAYRVGRKKDMEQDL